MQGHLVFLTSFVLHVAIATSSPSSWHPRRAVQYTETAPVMAADEEAEVADLSSKAAAFECKVTPYDPQWPSDQDWAALNRSINGCLIKSAPIASACWPGNPFGSSLDCNTVKSQWTDSYFHRAQPESVDFPIWANNSCSPPGSTGYSEQRGCSYGGYPRYIVDAWSEDQIATALKWAAARNLRVIIKGTGHDLYGRSVGAYAMSVITRNFRSIRYDAHWTPRGRGRAQEKETHNAIIVGSGLTWADVYQAAHRVGRMVVGGGTFSVGLGGHIGGGGHGPLSSRYGLAADNVLQATVVTTTGKVYICNDHTNTDLFWAIRGGGPGVYGVVTEFVLKTYPTLPATHSTLTVQATSDAGVAAAWRATAIIAGMLPTWMDSDIAGTYYSASGFLVGQFVPGWSETAYGPVTYLDLFTFDHDKAYMDSVIQPVIDQLRITSNNTLKITYTPRTEYPDFYSFASEFKQLLPVAYEAIQSGRLLRRASLEAPIAQVEERLRKVAKPQMDFVGSVVVLTMTAGKGPANVSRQRRGGLLPAWRESYIHAVANTAIVNPGETVPSKKLGEAAAWINQNTEREWQSWEPGTGAYMHEANPYSPTWQRDFFGESNYPTLSNVKRRYDPSESLFVFDGVGSERWRYDMDSGKLCRVRGGDDGPSPSGPSSGKPSTPGQGCPAPTENHTEKATEKPTERPTEKPTENPSVSSPSHSPSSSPPVHPSFPPSPTKSSTLQISASPSAAPPASSPSSARSGTTVRVDATPPAPQPSEPSETSSPPRGGFLGIFGWGRFGRGNDDGGRIRWGFGLGNFGGFW